MSDAQRWPPGWFRDPTGRHDHRWWDGGAWTAHVADAGVAGLDAIAGPVIGATGAVREGSSGRDRGPAAGGAPDGTAAVALATGVGALVLSIVPGLGLALAVAAVVLAVLARGRVRRSGRPGNGLALAALILGLVALVVSTLVTVVGLLLVSGSGGELGVVFREYVACLDTRTPEECRALLEESLLRITAR
jgi:hypothetical protein